MGHCLKRAVGAEGKVSSQETKPSKSPSLEGALIQHSTFVNSVQFSHSVMSDSLRPRGQENDRLPCPSPTPRACSDSCPLSRWCHPTMSSSVVPFSSCLQSCPASASFPVSRFFASGDQSIEVSASTSVLQWIFRTDFLWDGLVGSPCGLRDTQESSATVQKHHFLVLSFLYSPTLTSINDYWKNHSFD